MENSNPIPFEGKEIRKIWHNEQWYFSVVDVVQILTDSNNPNRYWSDLKRKLQKESQSDDFFVRLNMPRVGGKNYPSDAANTEGSLIIKVHHQNRFGRCHSHLLGNTAVNHILPKIAVFADENKPINAFFVGVFGQFPNGIRAVNRRHFKRY